MLVCGHLDTVVTKFPESEITKLYVLFVEGYHGRKVGHEKVPTDLVWIRTDDGEIYTVYYSDFFQLSKADQASVRDKRKRFGQTSKGRGKNSKNPTGMSVKAIKAIKAKMKAQTITISDMRAKFDVETDNPVTDDAVNSFGGRKEKKEAKRAKTKHYSDEE